MIEPKKILVAEDDENDAELILKALEKYNIANGVIIVEDGAEALDSLQARRLRDARGRQPRPGVARHQDAQSGWPGSSSRDQGRREAERSRR